MSPTDRARFNLGLKVSRALQERPRNIPKLRCGAILTLEPVCSDTVKLLSEEQTFCCFLNLYLALKQRVFKDAYKNAHNKIDK